jgi:hypothetical protein
LWIIFWDIIEWSTSTDAASIFCWESRVVITTTSGWVEVIPGRACIAKGISDGVIVRTELSNCVFNDAGGVVLASTTDTALRSSIEVGGIVVSTSIRVWVVPIRAGVSGSITSGVIINAWCFINDGSDTTSTLTALVPWGEVFGIPVTAARVVVIVVHRAGVSSSITSRVVIDALSSRSREDIWSSSIPGEWHTSVVIEVSVTISSHISIWNLVSWSIITIKGAIGKAWGPSFIIAALISWGRLGDTPIFTVLQTEHGVWDSGNFIVWPWAVGIISPGTKLGWYVVDEAEYGERYFHLIFK